jgi:hypothetical protein
MAMKNGLVLVLVIKVTATASSPPPPPLSVPVDPLPPHAVSVRVAALSSATGIKTLRAAHLRRCMYASRYVCPAIRLTTVSSHFYGILRLPSREMGVFLVTVLD